jgi:hypothetical protein
MINGYIKISEGHIYQDKITGETPVYSREYSELTYDKYQTTQQMSKLRFEIAKKFFRFNSILDFGYGNGSFLNICNENGIECYGYDISDYPLKPGIVRAITYGIEVDLITFFDSIEHLQERNLEDFLAGLYTNQILISVPWYHHIGDDWFFRWKHRRENEHFHHFSPSGLATIMERAGFTPIWHGNPEDEIRRPTSDLPNILTMAGIKF